MQNPPYPSLHSRYKSFTNRRSNEASTNGFFQNHPVGEIVRSLFFSSLLWMMLAVALYGVYSIVVGTT